MNKGGAAVLVAVLAAAFVAATWWQFGEMLTKSEACKAAGGEMIRSENSFGRWFCASVTRKTV